MGEDKDEASRLRAVGHVKEAIKRFEEASGANDGDAASRIRHIGAGFASLARALLEALEASSDAS